MSEDHFGAWLYAQRKRLDLSRPELAARVGCSADMLYRIERDLARPSKDLLIRILDSLAVPETARPALIATARRRAPTEATSRTEAPVPHNCWSVPAPLTGIYGRRAELQTLQRLIQKERARLITLVGPAGIGKTRLALELAYQMRPLLRNGALLVQLDNCTSFDQALQQIIEQLGLELAGREPLAGLSNALRDLQVLCILDGVDYIRDLGPAVARLLAGAPQLIVLCTSAAPLLVYGEHVLPLPPLEYPLGQDRTPVASDTPAIELLVQRIRAINPFQQLQAADMALLAQLAAALDGLPLALELAAALTDRLSLAEIVALAQRQPLALATTGEAGRMEHHNQLRAALGWSLEALPASHQRAVEALAVLPAQWPVEALGALLPALGCDLDAATAIAMLRRTQLIVPVAKTPPGEERRWFRSLHVIRAFAIDRLGQGSHREGGEHALAVWAVGWVRQTVAQIDDLGVWRTRLAVGYPLVEQVLEWWWQRCDAEQGLGLCLVLIKWWGLATHVGDGLVWFRRWLEPEPLELDPLLRARAWMAYSQLINHTDNGPEIDRILEQTRVLAEELGNPEVLAGCWNQIASRAYLLGDYQTALLGFEHGARYAQVAGNIELQTGCMINSAVLMRQRGEIDRAMEHYNKVLTLARAHHIPHIQYHALHNMSVVHIAHDMFAQAEELLAEALTISQQMKDASTTAAILYSMASAHLYQEHWSAAQQQLSKGQAIIEALQDKELADQYRCLQVLLLALRGQWSDVPPLLIEGLSRALQTGCVQDAFSLLDVVLLYEAHQNHWSRLAELVPALAAARRAQEYGRDRYVERQITRLWEHLPADLRAASEEHTPQEVSPVQNLVQTALLYLQQRPGNARRAS
ncbi:MAG: hypothetical protein OHK0022_16300 [Roseiflexaceae bacterium]